MKFSLVATLVVCGLLLAMLLASEIGRRVGNRHLAQGAGDLPKGVGAAEAAIFALLGLLLAFTFSGAASRFEDRRHLITAETNAIGTAYLRIDLLPADAQPALRDLFRRYVDVRLATYHDVKGEDAVNARLAEGSNLQGEIWTRAVEASMRPGNPTSMATLLLPALNEMIDITATRVMATRNHPPPIIFFLLVALSLVGALFLGYDTCVNRHRSWLHTVTLAAMLALTTYVIVDLEYPRFGFIRVDSADVAFVELKESMD